MRKSKRAEMGRQLRALTGLAALGPRVLTGRSKKTGLPPGTVVHIGERRREHAKITVMDYDEAGCRETTFVEAAACGAYRGAATTTWINVDGVHDTGVLETLGGQFEVSGLILEDIANTRQRPKFEEQDGRLFVVLKMISYDEVKAALVTEQVSLLLMRGVVLTFQEDVGDVFDPIRERIRGGKGRVRRSGAEFLFYLLVDAVVDHYFIVLERLGERIELLQEAVAANPTEEVLREIHRLKREVLELRRAVWPLREVIGELRASESQVLGKELGPFLRDVSDHVFHVLDTTETYREMASSMVDIYLSSMSNRMNAVMKVLTIIATIFIPLTFVAGVYGMNFDHMPELGWKWGYPAVLGVMAAVAGIMLIYFRRKRWL